MRSQWVAIVLGLTLIAAATVAAPAASERRVAAGSLDFQASFVLISTSVPCPADVPPNTTECRALTVQPSYPVPGLELDTESTYTLPLGLGPPTCPRASASRSRPTAGSALQARERSPSHCPREHGAWIPRRRGRSRRSSRSPAAQDRSPRPPGEGRSCEDRFLFLEGYPEAYSETWTGTLTIPGLHLTAPKLSGAVAKTVRAAKGAKSARVTFEVTATDNEGGDVPVSCWPRSGSRFPLGKTIVLCAATDSSSNWVTDFNGNTVSAAFTVTVKRRR